MEQGWVLFLYFHVSPLPIFSGFFSAGCLECLGYTETDHIRNDTHAGLTNFNDTILGTIQLLEKNKDLKTHYLKIALSISLFHI